MAIDPALVGTWLISCLSTYLVHSTCLLGGVWCLLRLRPTIGPGARELLWRTALVGGLLTTSTQRLFDLPGPFGELVVRIPKWSPTTDESAAPTVSAAKPVRSMARLDNKAVAESGMVLENFAEIVSRDTEALSAHPVTHAPAKLPPRASGPPANHLAWGVPFAVAGGLFVVGLLRCLAQTVVWRRRLVGAQELSDGKARRLLDELCRVLPRSREVRLLTAPECSEPAACGLSRWTIVLPVRSEKDLSEDELRSLLAHELAHLVRGDAWWLLVSRLICSCCGFQPLNHLARREWQRAAEHLCDAWAVSRTGSRLALARCLAEVAGWRSARPDCAASLAATGRRSELAARIERLVDDTPLAEPWREFRMRRKLAALAGGVLIALAGFGPRISVSAGDAPEPQESPAIAELGEILFPEPLEWAIPFAEPAEPAEPDAWDFGRVELTATAIAAAEPLGETDRPENVLRHLILENESELEALERELAELQSLLNGMNLPPRESRLRKLLKQFETQRDRRRATLDRLRGALGIGDRGPGNRPSLRRTVERAPKESAAHRRPEGGK